MKVLSTLAIMAFLAAPAYAAFDGPGASPSGRAGGGYQGPISGYAADTVEKTKNLSDDAPVLLTGNIIEQVAGTKDKYIFKDNTGRIKVEIDSKAFNGQTVTPNETVRLSGKVDKDFGKEIEVDVKMLKVVSQ